MKYVLSPVLCLMTWLFSPHACPSTFSYTTKFLKICQFLVQTEPGHAAHLISLSIQKVYILHMPWYFFLLLTRIPSFWFSRSNQIDRIALHRSNKRQYWTLQQYTCCQRQKVSPIAQIQKCTFCPRDKSLLQREFNVHKAKIILHSW